MIKIIIRVETDFDFTLGFPRLITGLYKINFIDGDYFIELHYKDEEEYAKHLLTSFLNDLSINSTKDFHEKDFAEGISRYTNDLKKTGLNSSTFELLSGNWSFTVDIYRVNEEYLMSK